MAVPKKKTSKSKTRNRKAMSWKLKSPGRSKCSNCGAVKKPHRVCHNCGHYKGRTALEIE